MPSREENEAFWTKIQNVIDWALLQLKEQQGEGIARAVAQRLDDRQWRLMTEVDVNADGEPVLGSLWYKVEVRTDQGGWIELCKAHSQVLGVSEENARDEIHMTALQHGIGIPDDLSGLDKKKDD
jgi:hypothetical protein